VGLEENRFTEFPTALLSLHQLTSINLSTNLMTTLSDQTINDINHKVGWQIDTLQLRENPWSDDARMRILRDIVGLENSPLE
jgi:hypothetical protein